MPTIKLEIISRGPATGTPKPRKLLFVHGICVGAWIWEQNFLPYFAAHGYEAHAVSLRGHGNSEGLENISSWSLTDYTDDVAEAVRKIGGDIVVIGHSLGGAVVQNWLRTGGHAKGAALFASVPPWGLSPSAWRMGLTNPMLFQELAKMITFGVAAANPDIIRGGLFSPNVPDSTYTTFINKVQDESKVVSAELQGLRPFAPTPWQTPKMFVAGGANDKLIPSDEVWKTGLYYGTKPVVLDDLAHTIMLDTNWETAANALLTWLETLNN